MVDLVETTWRTKDPFWDKSMTSVIRTCWFKEIANEGDNNVDGGTRVVVHENRGLEKSCQGDKKSRGVERHVSKLGQEDSGCRDIHVGVEGTGKGVSLTRGRVLFRLYRIKGRLLECPQCSWWQLGPWDPWLKRYAHGWNYEDERWGLKRMDISPPRTRRFASRCTT